MSMFDTEEQMRCAFAAFALQGLMAAVDPEILDSEHNRKFFAEAAFDMADAMMGVRSASTRH